MSAIGPKRTFPLALHMSAFGGKADMPFSLLRKSAFAVAIGGKADIGFCGAYVRFDSNRGQWCWRKRERIPRRQINYFHDSGMTVSTAMRLHQTVRLDRYF